MNYKLPIKNNKGNIHWNELGWHLKTAQHQLNFAEFKANGKSNTDFDTIWVRSMLNAFENSPLRG